MTIYIVTGHLGSGKTLCAVGMAREYLAQGKRIASNITLNLDKLCPEYSKLTTTKLPGFPRASDLEAIGRGDIKGDWKDWGMNTVKADGNQYDESKFGLVILDEAGSWLNSQDWKDPDRRGLFRWLTHARKFGWDVALIVQDWESLDAQTRRSITEVVISCARLDRLKVLGMGMPKVHLATHRYKAPNGPSIKRSFYKAQELYGAYDTREAIRKDEDFTENGPVDTRAVFSQLSAWHLKGRYMPQNPPREVYFFLGIKWALTLVLLPLFIIKGVSLAPSIGADLRANFPRRYWQPPKHLA